MADQLTIFKDNRGPITINNNGRPQKNGRESLSTPISIRLYEDEKQAIQKRQFESDLSRNEVIQRCVQIGLRNWDILDWIDNNADTVRLLAKRYHRAKEGDKST